MSGELAAGPIAERPDIPDLIGERYRVLDLLGRGGMAEVVRARDEIGGREVAVKVLRDEGEGDLRRFIREALTLAPLAHPGLVSLLDAGLHAETPYLVMDLVEGTTMAPLLDEPVTPELAAEIGIAVADALAYAHGHGVVHRDVKPGNVLLSRDGEVRLADFGIAKLAGERSSQTSAGTIIGSVHYLAPEQVTREPVTPAVDIYALGMLLLRALTGRHAFSGTNVEAAIARLTTDPEIPDELGPDWCELLAGMTAREPDDRPDAQTVADQLRLISTASAPAPSGATPVAETTD